MDTIIQFSDDLGDKLMDYCETHANTDEEARLLFEELDEREIIFSDIDAVAQICDNLCKRLMDYLATQASTDKEAKLLYEELKEEREIIFDGAKKMMGDASLNTTAPTKYWLYHHPGCGTDYRGCHPSKCPKNEYEKTRVWQQPLVDEINKAGIRT